MKKWFQNNSTFCYFFLLAVILRFYKIWDLPLDSDELSAILRAQKSNSFISNIDIGVLTDGHPFFVQTLIWIIIGTLKLPLFSLKILWALISLWSIFLTYNIINRVLNKTSAIFTTAFLSILWWTVDTSTWVRPYTVGLLAVLIAIDAISKLHNESKVSWMIQAVFGILLSISTHYFAGLTILLYSLFFLIFYPKNWKWILGVGGISLILYLPQLFILRNHLGLMGLNWLSKPSYHFIYNHLYFAFNKQIAVISLLLVSCGFGGWQIYSNKTKLAKHFGVFGLSWLSVLFVGYIYSILRKPVLQDNVLYFTFPFLLASGGYLFSQIPQKFNSSFFALIAFLGIFDLIFSKQHFDLGLKDKYEYPMRKISDKSVSIEASKWIFLVDGPVDVLNFHSTHFNIPQKTKIYYSSNNSKNFVEFTNSIVYSLKPGDTLLYAMNSGSNLTQLALLKFNLKHISISGSPIDHFIGGSIYYFVQKDSLKSGIEQPSKSLNIFVDSNYLFRWSEISSKIHEMKEDQKIAKNDFLIVTFRPTDSVDSYHLVSSILNLGFNKALSQIDYRFTDSKIFKGYSGNTVIHSIKLSDIPFWNDESYLRISVESKEYGKLTKKRAQGELKVYHFKGNPFLYGI